MKFLFITLSIFYSLHSIYAESENSSRRTRKALNQLKEYNVQSPQELEAQAQHFTLNGEYTLAIKRYQALLTWFPKHKHEKEIYLLVAGLHYKNNEPKESIFILEKFGKKYPDSIQMTHCVKLAFQIGKNYILEINEAYNGVGAKKYTKRAFKFVITHDPYSPEAAESLLTNAVLSMKAKEYEEAIIHLKDLHSKQPGTNYAAQADVYLGECFLRMNKGAKYSNDLLEKARRYLENHQKHNQTGPYTTKVKQLISEVYSRIGQLRVDNIRYYFTCRKWKAAKFYIDKTLDEPKLSMIHPEVLKLKIHVEKRI